MTKREQTTMTPLGALFRGTTAGAVGIAAMDVLRYARYRRGGGTQGLVAWETSAGLSDWDGAPAPALAGKRLAEGVFGIELAPRWARLTNNLTHWGLGKLWGGGYGMVAGTTGDTRAWHGPALGTLVFGTSYVVLPLAKLYRPIWEYDAKTLAEDYSAHLVYGIATALAFRVVSSVGGCRRAP
ncbi:MAG: hypothetical protein QOI56_1283 [Actinomycetota bacterium]|jgi:hypothetical protein|nr:hypothetical protein [Actinomycetota bacterium]